MTNLFEKLLLRLFDDGGVSVAHHGNQHVEEEDGDQDLKEDEDHLGHVGVVALPEQVILPNRNNRNCEIKLS